MAELQKGLQEGKFVRSFLQFCNSAILQLFAATDSQAADLLDRVLDLRFENQLADEGRRGARIPDVTLAVVVFPGRELVEAEHAGVDIHETRRVLAAGVRADGFLAHAVRRGNLVAASGVVVAHVVDADVRARPFLVEHFGNDLLAGLVAAAVANHRDVEEPGAPEASRRILEHFLVGIFRRGDRAGEPHVAGGRFRARYITLRNVGHHRRDDRVAELLRDLASLVANEKIVLAQDHDRAILLGAAGRDGHGRLAGGNGVAKLDPREIFEEHARWRGKRRRVLDLGLRRSGGGENGKDTESSDESHSTSLMKNAGWKIDTSYRMRRGSRRAGAPYTFGLVQPSIKRSALAGPQLCCSYSSTGAGRSRTGCTTRQAASTSSSLTKRD